MFVEPSSGPKSPIKNPLVYTFVTVAIVLVAVVFTMLSRWINTTAIERAAKQQRAEKQREQDRIAVERLGGKNFDILMFYASPRVIQRGDSAKLCYGVSNAKTVALEPQEHAVWPSVSNCVDVSPTKTTTYTLTILDDAGHSKSQSLDLTVR